MGRSWPTTPRSSSSAASRSEGTQHKSNTPRSWAPIEVTLVIAVLKAAVTDGEEFPSLPSQSDQLAGLTATLIVPPPSLASTTCAALACVGLDHQKWVKKPVPEPAPDGAK